MTKFHVMVYKSQVQKVSFMHSVLKFVDFASFICIFGHIITIEKQVNLETLHSWVCAFVFCLNQLHQLLMLGPEQQYHKKHSPERRLGSSQQRMMGQTIEELGTAGSVTAGWISVIHIFSPSLAIIMLQFRMLKF